MKDLARFNIDMIIVLEVRPSEESDDFVYKKERRTKLFNILLQKKGIYARRQLYMDSYKLEDMPKNHYIKDGKVYEKAYVRAYMVGGHRKKWHCTSFEAAKNIREEIIQRGLSLYLKDDLKDTLKTDHLQIKDVCSLTVCKHCGRVIGGIPMKGKRPNVKNY